jgi:hypothetical protein
MSDLPGTLDAVGMNNRQRRAAKARRRASQGNRQQPPRTEDAWTSREFRIGVASLALRQLVLGWAGGRRSMIDAEQFRRQPEEHRILAVDDQLGFLVRHTFAHGWTPLDLHEVSRRKLDRAVVDHLMAVVMQESTGWLDQEWTAQLRRLSSAKASGSISWARRMQLSWPAAEHALIELLVLLAALPSVERVLPAPGSPPAMRRDTRGVDDDVLRKVRALLAKAESTQFTEEAEALTAKAQQLMTEHSITHTLAAASQAQRPVAVARRVWLDAPYVDAKSLLVDAVARSNHCASVLASRWGFVTLVGHDNDLDTVELLATSLLVQASRAMTATGSHVTRTGRSRTRSFRHSFLVAYASRIGERLQRSASDAESSADADRGGSLLPVLAARDDAVHEAMAAMFPELTQKQFTVSDLAGWGAGRAAADLAQFDVREAIGEQERAG